MRHIKVRNAEKVEAEISARSYKKLCHHLKGYNRKQLWKIMDHYIFHVMEDHHVEELLQILDDFKKTNSFEEESFTSTPKSPMPEGKTKPSMQNHQEARIDVSSAAVEEVDAPLLETGMRFDTIITAEDMDRSKKQMDLLYDVTYFTYLTPNAAQSNARALLAYAKENDVPAPAHWYLIAASGDFFTLEDEEETAE